MIIYYFIIIPINY